MTITVLDANDNPVVLNRPNANGRQNAAGSRPTAWATEDLAAINALGALLGTGNASLAQILAELEANDLPTGAATAAAQAAGNALLTTIANAVAASATAALQTAANNLLSDMLARLNDPLGVTQDGAFDVNITNPSIEATFTDYPGVTNAQRLATPSPVVDGSASFVFNDFSGTTAGGLETLRPADASRRAVEFQNTGSVNMRIRGTGDASASRGWLIQPGKTWRRYGAACPKGALTLWCGDPLEPFELLVA